MVERIVDAGRTVLLERGYDGASTNHIALAAGISPGSLYQYFGDKAGVLHEVLDRYTDGLETRISRAFVSAMSTEDTSMAVRHILLALLDAFEEHPGLLRVLVEQLPRSADSRRAAFARRIDDMTTAALLTIHRGEEDRPVDAVAWVLVRTVEHVTISYVLERPAIAREALVTKLTELVAHQVERRPHGSSRT